MIKCLKNFWIAAEIKYFSSLSPCPYLGTKCVKVRSTSGSEASPSKPLLIYRGLFSFPLRCTCEANGIWISSIQLFCFFFFVASSCEVNDITRETFWETDTFSKCSWNFSHRCVVISPNCFLNFAPEVYPNQLCLDEAEWQTWILVDGK